MTTPIVQSISDEQLAELVRECRTGADEHGGMGHEYDSGLFDRLGDALEQMHARLRAAEADAKRYRFLRDKNTSPGFLCNNDRAADYANEHMACGEAMDRLIDSEMESVQYRLSPSAHN